MSQVHRNLNERGEPHPIDFVDDGPAKRPVVWYETIDIDLPLVSPAVESDEATA